MGSVHLEFSQLYNGALFVRKELNRKGERIFSQSDSIPCGAKNPGVYIWGYIANGEFIPSYVGKHESSIARRIHDHLKDILKPESTYMRLKKSYIEGLSGMEPFYKDERYPLFTSRWRKDRLPSWFRNDLEHFIERIDYLNNRGFMELDPIGREAEFRGKEYPISNIKYGLDDYMVNNIDKIFVSYASCSYDCSIGLEKKAFYERLETAVKFSLKGKTSGMSMPLEGIKGFPVTIGCDGSIKKIFKDGPSLTFEGY